MANNEKDEEQTSRKPFVAQGDRPEVRLKLDAPISDLRVRDLAAILRLGTGKDFWDGKDWQKDEKAEKPEIKEAKAEKLENDGVFEPRLFPRPDPRLDEVIRALVGLTERVSQLAGQVEALKKERKS